MFLMEWGPEMEGIIVCERFFDQRALSQKYEAEMKDTDRKDRIFYVKLMIKL